MKYLPIIFLFLLLVVLLIISCAKEFKDLKKKRREIDKK